MSDFGGEMRFSIDGTPVTMKGLFQVNPSNRTVEESVNQDGSVDAVHTLAGHRMAMTLVDNGGVDVHALLKGPARNVTVVEEHTGVTHMWTQARFAGDPQSDRLTGEITGLRLVSASYRRV
ncbi:Phage tail tube protein [Pseudoxanthobacter soli DSM 19599]|uniref:Phage tail tube protein n=1 Tax=Pseudoxanthobacter soli DSM 19599 TaxID=1123029 RepID=A0A1M7ZMD4_9HYPH|nr:phage tail tube protein [Pseudoxanthobacter soli]SHO65816.1 Phage tail tube protein [Pseudoxanthobacter soli DSM 19599]